MACRHSPDEANQNATAQITRAVEMLRKASNHDKRIWLGQLQKLNCRSPDVCQFRALCIAAYEEHLGGVALIEQARASAAVVNGGKAVASTDALVSALAGVEAAERKLRAAKQQTQACAENEAIIRQRYRL
jgi:hypothetical protein